MNLYFELLKKPIFTVADVNEYYDNIASARSAVKRLMHEKMSVKIRNDMYLCISGETGAPVANRFQIAGSITPTSCVSHHTAMEYYGITDQVFYDVYVSSKTGFRGFEFDGYSYHCVASRISEGIDRPEYSGGIAVTDQERTLIDSIKDMDKIGGMEEILKDIENFRHLNENKLLKYLELYKNQFLYQKTGFLLSGLREQLGLSEQFFCICKGMIKKSKRYLTRDITTGNYNNEWNLIIPVNMKIQNGGAKNAAI